MRLYIFDDRQADAWQPFALSRPCSELLFGALLLRQRLERFAGAAAVGLITRPWLSSYSEPGAPPAASAEEIDEAEDRLFLCARAIPEAGERFKPPPTASTIRIGEDVVGAYVPRGEDAPDESWFGAPAPIPGATQEIEGDVLQHVWDLVVRSPERTRADLEAGVVEVGPPLSSPPVQRLGSAPLLLAADVQIEPGVVFDLRSGPICLDRGVEVRAGTRLAGPLYAGPSSRLLGGSIAGLSAGPFSYLRGEIEGTVVLGYTNKAHDGFLGHAYVGRWVNLGALTTNSDLKNTYGSVRLAGPGGEIDTGLMKLGCLIGDHVKTAIGTLIGTGSVLGCGANVFGGAPPRFMPPFSWGDSATEHRLEGFLRTAAVAAERRGLRFGEADRTWWSAVWEAGRAQRG